MATSDNIFPMFIKIDEDYNEVILVCKIPSTLILIHNSCDLLNSIQTYSCKTVYKH